MVLSPGAAALAFLRFFAAHAPAPLPEGLTPGDFSAVRRKASVLNMTDPARLHAWMCEEARDKGAMRAPVGFVHAAEPWKVLEGGDHGGDRVVPFRPAAGDF